MLFNSLHFLLFFPLVCVLYFLLPRTRWRNAFLLLASYYFYMSWEPAYALLLLCSTVVTYLAARGMERHAGPARRRLLLANLGVNFGILFLFKYFNFAAENLNALLAPSGLAMSLPSLPLLLPMGISFYTFQAVGYSLDVYRGETAAERSFVDYALFVSFFPQLVAGPIERSSRLLPQFKRRHAFSYESASGGLRLMLWGFFLKLCVADRAALYVDAVFNNLPMHNGGSYLLAALLFALQIYGDFAGYSLVAIGAARVMGFRLMDNFRRPYLAASVTEFWRRWHISLSTWLRDYVYVPLGGSRRGPGRMHRNLLLTFLVSGLWHGASWTFVVWGAIHGLLVMGERVLGWHRARWTGARRVLHIGLTLGLVCLAWVFFRAESIADAWTLLRGIALRPGLPYLPKAQLLALFLSLLILALRELSQELGWRLSLLDHRRWLVRGLGIVGLTLFILWLGVFNGAQFIYFQF